MIATASITSRFRTFIAYDTYPFESSVSSDCPIRWLLTGGIAFSADRPLSLVGTNEKEDTPTKHIGFVGGPLRLSMPRPSITLNCYSLWVIILLLALATIFRPAFMLYL